MREANPIVLDGGWASFRGQVPQSMDRPQTQNVISVGWVTDGEVVAMFNGRPYRHSKGQVCVLWAAVPYQVMHASADCMYWCLTLPLAWFLGWRLPQTFVDTIMQGEVIFDAQPPSPEAEEEAFRRWQQLLAAGATPEDQRIVMLEGEARLRRIARTFEPRAAKRSVTSPPIRFEKAYEMMRFMSAHSTEPLTLKDIASSAGLNSNYASTLFRQLTHRTISDYLTRQRLAHAQRLLATTDAKILAVAMESGFSSPARFYASFKKICGQNPLAYRRSM